MECSICFDPIIVNDDKNRAILDCEHEFHAKCILNWLKYQPTCPICRKRHIEKTTTNERNSIIVRLMHTSSQPVPSVSSQRVPSASPQPVPSVSFQRVLLQPDEYTEDERYHVHLQSEVNERIHNMIIASVSQRDSSHWRNRFPF